MSAALRKVALVSGSGHLGPYLLKALQANNDFHVTVVSRKSSTAQFPANINVVKISDSYPKSEILDVFKGQDAVVLSLNFATEFQHHNMLVDASIEAGVKRLIPSTWSGRIDLAEARDIFPLAASKAGALDYVKSKVVSAPGWSYTAVACGLFMDLSVQTNFFGLDPATRTGTIWDDGTQTFSATNMDTIGLAVTKILTLPETANRTVYISSFEPSMNDMLAAYKTATGPDWDINHRPVQQGIDEALETSKSSENFMDKMRAVGLLGLLVGLKKGLGADFVAEGLSDNELLGIPREDLVESVKRNVKG